MQFNTYLSKAKQIDLLLQANIKEVILEHTVLSRLGKLNTAELLELLDKAHSSGLSPVLQWDILSTENTFQNCLKLLVQLPLHKFYAIRVQDSGAAEWVKQQYPNIPIHWIVETGNHNLAGLQRWVEYFGIQLKRLILSTELPFPVLKEYSEKLKIPTEILAIGRILLFYTPRNLLSFQEAIPQNSNAYLEKTLISEEQPKHQFPSIENQHGTFMFHHRDLYLLDVIPELKQTNIEFLRLDLRHLKSTALILQISSLLDNFEKEKADEIKKHWPVKITHGFFQANRTDRAIKRLKNPHLQDHGEHLVAHVVEALKGEHLILFARKSFKKGEALISMNPEGRQSTISTDKLFTTKGEAIDEVISGSLCKVSHVKFVTAQSLIYRQIE